MKNLCLTFLLFFAVNTQAQNVWDGGGSIPTLTTNGNLGIGLFGANARFSISNTITNHGIVQNTTNANAGTQYGISNTLSSSSSTGIKYGMYNSVSGSTSSSTYGIYNNNSALSTGTKYGIYSLVTGLGTGAGYGIYSTVTGSSTIKYGVYSVVSNTGTNNSSTDATSFGLFSQGTGANSRAGYFKGDIEINQGNTIYSAINGSKTLILENYGVDDYSYTIAMNQTNGLYDWSFYRAFVLNRAGEMIKGCDGPGKVFMIKRYDQGGQDVFQVWGDGHVFATELHVRIASEFPDYVFKPSYNLLPLSGLKSFIQINGRLPNMPSAQMVASEGVSVGEMTTTLVEKIEELTLYILDMEDRILKQQLELERLKLCLEKSK